MVTAAEAIFLRAQQAWVQRVVPPYESFQIACAKTFLKERCQGDQTVEFTVRASDGRTFARTLATSTTPSRILLHGDYITGPDGTPLGFYRALPAKPGGIVPSPPPNMAPDPLIPTIAVATTIVTAYRIALVGAEQVGAYACDHLSLRPLDDPQRFALRDLWVDRATGNVVQLTYSHDFGNGRYGTVEYRFAPEGPQHDWTIVHIEADSPAGSAYGKEHVASDLSDIAFPQSVPDTEFEP
jgi:hypothetical protein